MRWYRHSTSGPGVNAPSISQSALSLPPYLDELHHAPADVRNDRQLARSDVVVGRPVLGQLRAQHQLVQ